LIKIFDWKYSVKTVYYRPSTKQHQVLNACRIAEVRAPGRYNSIQLMTVFSWIQRRMGASFLRYLAIEECASTRKSEAFVSMRNGLIMMGARRIDAEVNLSLMS